MNFNKLYYEYQFFNTINIRIKYFNLYILKINLKKNEKSVPKSLKSNFFLFKMYKIQIQSFIYLNNNEIQFAKLHHKEKSKCKSI